jgi:Gas vesicle protein G
MDLLTLIFRLPFLPLRAVIALGDLIREQVDQEQYDPAAVRRQLEDVEDARAAGAISDEELARIEDEVLGRLVPASRADDGDSSR